MMPVVVSITISSAYYTLGPRTMPCHAMSERERERERERGGGGGGGEFSVAVNDAIGKVDRV